MDATRGHGPPMFASGPEHTICLVPTVNQYHARMSPISTTCIGRQGQNFSLIHDSNPRKKMPMARIAVESEYDMDGC